MNAGLNVAVFRHTLFLPSERFIPDQVLALPEVSPVMIARDDVVAGVEGLEARSLSNFGRLNVYRHTLLRDPGPLERLLGEVNADVVHAHFGVEGMYAFKATQRLNLPLVTTLHGFDVTVSTSNLLRSGRPAWLHYALGRRGFLSSDSEFICVSEHIKKLALRFGAREEKCHVIGTGVAVEQIAATPLPEKDVVLHVARLVEKKGTEYLIRAFALVLKKNPKAELRIIGEGPLRADLERLARELCGDKSVVFMGAQSHANVLAAIQECAVFCLPSVTAGSGDQEGLGQVVLEAAASARPVVATRHGGLREAVEDAVTGLLVAERDSFGLANALIHTLEDRSVARDFGIAGRQMVLRNFDHKLQAKKVEAVYRSLI